MIRRWSYVITLENDFCSRFYFKKRFKFRIFRLNVKFRRFSIKKTKFKRKSLIRLKHWNNFSLIFNSLKYWTYDFKFVKNYTKYQFFFNSFANSTLVFNPSAIKLVNEYFFHNFEGKIINITKRLLKRYYTNYIYSVKNMNLTVATHEEIFDKTTIVVPFAAYHDLNLFDFKLTENFLISLTLNNSENFNKILLKKYFFLIVEIKKFAHYTILNNFFNVKNFVFKNN